MAEKSKARRPSGAAVPGAVERIVNFPKTLVFMVSQPSYDRVSRESGSGSGKSKSEVGRYYLELGMRAHDAGFGRTPGGA